MNNRTTGGRTNTSAVERRFAVVKFFGPKRNASGKLWGFVVLAEGPHAGQDLYVTEPHFGATSVAEGAIRIVGVVSGSRGPQVKSADKWVPDSAGIDALAAASRELRETETGRQVLRTLVPEIAADACPSALLAFHTDDTLANRARGHKGFVDTLATSLGEGGSLNWLHRLRNFPQVSTQDLISLSRLMVGAWRLDLASRLVGAVEAFDDATISELCELDPSWRGLLLRHLPAIDILRSAVLMDPMSENDRFALVVRAASTIKGAQAVVNEHDLGRLNELARSFGGTLTDHQVAQLHPSFLAAVPALLEGMRAGALLTVCAKVLATASEGDEVGRLTDIAEDALSAWLAAGPGSDLATGAARQAAVLVCFPPALAERLAANTALLPELQHILGCGDDLSCLDDSRLHMRAGHAVGALLMAELAGPHQLAATRQRITSALLGTELPLTAETAGRVMLRVAEEVRTMFDRHEMEGQVGALLRLLPRCPLGEAPFCEAKPPGLDPEGNLYAQPFCPRTKHGCHAGVVGPSLAQPVEHWGLMELVGSSGRAPIALYGKTLINSVAGWVNRLFELRERMTCDGCGSGLTFDARYSKKFDAAYHSTVMECPDHCGAPQVYFNHCYSCHGLIDSRESMFIEPSSDLYGTPASRAGGGHYLCIHCANGLKPWCPKCGQPTPRRQGAHVGTCQSCGHVVRSNTRAVLPRVAAPVVAGPWDEVYLHLDEHPGWTIRTELPALRRLKSGGAGNPWLDDF